MFKKFFNAVEARVFGSEMAAFIADRTPISPVDNNQLRQLKRYDKRHEATLVLIEKKLDRFKKISTFNIYIKAQLGSAFKYRLLDKAYDQEFCEKKSPGAHLSVINHVVFAQGFVQVAGSVYTRDSAFGSPEKYRATFKSSKTRPLFPAGQRGNAAG